LQPLPLPLLLRHTAAFHSHFTHSFRLHETWGTMHEGEGDEMKASGRGICVTRRPDAVVQRIFVEGDPILLAITGCVSVLHTLFDMLRQKRNIPPAASSLPLPPPISPPHDALPPAASRTTSRSGRASRACKARTCTPLPPPPFFTACAGLSVRSIFVSVFCQGVVFLYLMDNETSWMVLFSSGSGLLIEIWKMTKVVVVVVVVVVWLWWCRLWWW